jgi:hypothetical protein
VQQIADWLRIAFAQFLSAESPGLIWIARNCSIAEYLNSARSSRRRVSLSPQIKFLGRHNLKSVASLNRPYSGGHRPRSSIDSIAARPGRGTA